MVFFIFIKLKFYQSNRIFKPNKTLDLWFSVFLYDKNEQIENCSDNYMFYDII